jgi:uncharacterized protein
MADVFRWDALLRATLRVEPLSPGQSRVHLLLPRGRQGLPTSAQLHAVRMLTCIRLDVPRMVKALIAQPAWRTHPPRILITGSSGGIGQRMLAFFEGLGWRVDRLVRRRQLRTSNHFREWFWDAQTTIDAHALEGADAVVHLAGRSIMTTRWSREQRDDFRNSRVNGTNLLARAIAQCKTPPKVLLCASGIHLYGDRGDDSLLENAGPGTGFLAHLTRDWEQASLPARDGPTGVRTLLLRMPMVLDRDSGALRGLVPSFRLGLGLILGTGRQWWPWVAMEDLLGASLHAIATTSMQGPVNVVAPEEVSAAEFSRALAHALDRGLCARLPVALVRTLLGSQAEAALHSVRAVPQALRAAQFQFAFPALANTLACELAPTPAQLALASGVAWDVESGAGSSHTSNDPGPTNPLS